MLIKGDNKNRGKWNVGIVKDLYHVADGEVRAVELRVGNKIYERVIQHLYPMELSCNLEGMNQDEKELNANAEEFRGTVHTQTAMQNVISTFVGGWVFRLDVLRGSLVQS